MTSIEFMTTVIIGVLIILFIVIIASLITGKVLNYFKAREDAKWDADLFMLPAIYPPLSKYDVTRSIDTHTGYLVFTWENSTHKLTRKHHFKSVKAALAEYKTLFAKQEVLFYNQALDTLEAITDNRDLIRDLEVKLKAIENKADLIESDLNQLKKDLGDSDD